ncbi:phospholipase D-like domain-containing protein [Odoribacter sp. OttesenSCG-928-J03]|nr:phospholipase D-like domain-containing protein [Odoribacter sp. OttesenSCG-928-J03]
MIAMNNTLIDNSQDFKFVNRLKQLIVDERCNHILIATGYWDLPGTALLYSELKSFLFRGGKLDIMIGQEPMLRSYQMRADLTKEEKFPDFYIQKDIERLSDEYKAIVQLLLDYTNAEDEDLSQIKIRIYGQGISPKQFLHAKCYIFLGEGFAHGIIGSSNFTEKGLQENAELNYLETNSSIVASEMNAHISSKSHKVWFEEKWEQSKPWSGKFIKEILTPSPIGIKVNKEKVAEKSLTPYELYIKLLQYKFGDIVDKNLHEMIENYLPQHFDPLDYQIAAVKQCYSIMKEHGGFMLADVVGLGKTIVGTLLIKHFLSLPDDDGRDRKVLIITPPAIQSSWKETIDLFDKDTISKIKDDIDFITTGSISKLVDDFDDAFEDSDELDTGDFSSTLDYKNYGLIIIDESHKFRNSGTAMYKSLDDLIAQIGGETGAYPYIGLLSATPQNNRPDDLKNQIYLFERNHSDCTLKKANGGNLESFFSDINKRYAQLIKVPENIADTGSFDQSINKEERQEKLKKISEEIRDCVLQDVLVRRTRTDVKVYYEHDIVKQGIVFPEIIGPKSLEYKMETGLAKLFFDTMNYIAPKENFLFNDSQYLCYYRYRAIEFLQDAEIKNKYSGRNMAPDRFSRQLARIMQINLVKRIESSFSAFKSSLQNLRRYTQNMIDMWEQNVIFICPQIDVNAELDYDKHFEKTGRFYSFEDCSDNIRAKIRKLDETGNNKDGRNKEYTRNDFFPEYINLLRKDMKLIDYLCKKWSLYSNDPKLDVFKKELRTTLFDKQRNPSQKLVIFSESVDTVNAIEQAIQNSEEALSALVVTSKNRKDVEAIIKENFDANYKGEWKNDYQVIITTEVLAEGINLHRANSILNYDTPWNSTRLMQRIGRVNRIGSTTQYVYVYNFMPSAQGDAEIKLVQKAHTKLQSFHTLFGEDSQVFSEEEEVIHYDLNMQINGEESPLEKYVYELKEYKQNNPERYAFIERQEENLEMAVKSGDGNSFFLVRTPNMSGMFVSCDAEMKCNVVSAIDMYKSFYTEPEAVSDKLPENWEELKKKAELTVNITLNRMNIHTRKSARATKAKEIINRMNENQSMSDESRQMLATAFKLVNNGNHDIIRKIIAVEELLKSEQQALFEFTQSDFDKIIQDEIANMVANVQRKHGKAEVFMGISK